MTGEYTRATIGADGLQVRLRSGESRILLCSDNEDIYPEEMKEDVYANNGDAIDLTANKWTLCFTEEHPKVACTYKLDRLQTWETLGDSAAVTMGTGVYETVVKLSAADAKCQWFIDLGDVRESARVYINNVYIGCAWAVPFILDCKNSLKKGKNTIRIEVTNLPANRIADLDRQGVNWRKFKDTNIVSLDYKKKPYTDWNPVPSGLNSPVKLVEMTESK